MNGPWVFLVRKPAAVAVTGRGAVPGDAEGMKVSHGTAAPPLPGVVHQTHAGHQVLAGHRRAVRHRWAVHRLGQRGHQGARVASARVSARLSTLQGLGTGRHQSSGARRPAAERATAGSSARIKNSTATNQGVPRSWLSVYRPQPTTWTY